MRTEDDLRAALTALESRAPDALAVLAAVRTRVSARHVTNRRRWSRSLLAATAAVSVASVAAATALVAGLLLPASGSRPTAGARDAAAMLRRLAADAATQPVPALGPVLYTKDAFWVSGDRSQHHGLLNRVGDPYIEQEWVSAAVHFITAPNQHSGLAPGQIPSSYSKLDPEHNPHWNWLDPATLPADPAALRQRLLSWPGGRAARIGGIRATRDQALFSAAMEFMSSEPLRPAVRASMLRLIADLAQRSARTFAVLGTVTDRAGHRDVAIGWQSQEILSYRPIQHKWKLLHTSSTTELGIFLFDRVTGALRADGYATCTGPVSTLTMAGVRCTLESYEQYLVIKAVRSLPMGASASRSSRLVPYVFRAPWQPLIR